jgi:hypothetical protein
MDDDLAEVLRIRKERMALECVDVPCAARRLTIMWVSHDRVVIHHDGTPLCPKKEVDQVKDPAGTAVR